MCGSLFVSLAAIDCIGRLAESFAKSFASHVVPPRAINSSLVKVALNVDTHEYDFDVVRLIFSFCPVRFDDAEWAANKHAMIKGAVERHVHHTNLRKYFTSQVFFKSPTSRTSDKYASSCPG